MFKLIGGLIGNVVGGYKTILVGLVVIGMLTGGFYWYFKWSQHEIATLRDNAAKLEMAVAEQKKTIDALQKFQKEQNQNILALQNSLNESESYRKSLEEKFLKHDLEYLARQKPALIEKTLNDATSKILRQLETDTGAKPPAASTPTVCSNKKDPKCKADPVVTKPPLAN